MAGATARLVKRESIIEAKKKLALAVSRLEQSIDIMNSNDIEEIMMRAHVAMTRGVQAVCSMASEAQTRAEDAFVAKDMGVPTKIERSQLRHGTNKKGKSK